MAELVVEMTIEEVAPIERHLLVEMIALTVCLEEADLRPDLLLQERSTTSVIRTESMKKELKLYKKATPRFRDGFLKEAYLRMHEIRRR